MFSSLSYPGEDNDGYRDDGPEDDSVEERCDYPGCGEDAVAECECCKGSTHFCEDHGSRGGDRQVQDVGAVAYPGACWKCGGFNVDEGQEAAYAAADDRFTEKAEESLI